MKNLFGAIMFFGFGFSFFFWGFDCPFGKVDQFLSFLAATYNMVRGMEMLLGASMTPVTKYIAKLYLR